MADDSTLSMYMQYYEILYRSTSYNGLPPHRLGMCSHSPGKSSRDLYHMWDKWSTVVWSPSAVTCIICPTAEAFWNITQQSCCRNSIVIPKMLVLPVHECRIQLQAFPIFSTPSHAALLSSLIFRYLQSFECLWSLMGLEMCSFLNVLKNVLRAL